MKISKCKYKYNKQAPVMFMIDDLANKYINLKNNSLIGQDWGGKAFEKNSFWDILNKEILCKFPYVKITMFLVTGRRVPIIINGNNFYSGTIEESETFIAFLNELNKKNNIELAYHGYEHGVPSDNIYKFKEEWEVFKSLDEAIETIEKGKNLFEKVTGSNFVGGKYCGYKFNEFSDKSIVKTNFKWWCRHWDGELFYCNNDKLSFELEEFDGVVDIPSNIDGSLYSVKNYKKIFTKKYLKSIYLLLKKRITLEKQLEFLIKNRYVISIQEHTSPYRVDDRIQYPNIVSDKENLTYIFNYLKKYDLWYATGTEIAEYYNAFIYSNLEIENNKLKITCNKIINESELTVEFEDENAIEIILYNEEEKVKLKKVNNEKFIGEIKIKRNNEYKIDIVYSKEY